jgi:class 3 adenylate cyclase
MLDDRQDYFGQTVNIAARVQGLAEPSAILATKPIIESGEVARLLSESNYRTTTRQSMLRGVSESLDIYEVRERETASAA